MAGVSDKLAADAAIRGGASNKDLTVEQRSKLIDLWATHPGNATLHASKPRKNVNYAKGGPVRHENKGYRRIS